MHRGFGASLNEGLRVTDKPLVVFMHSDCEIKDRKWLVNLVNSYNNLKGHGAKLVSARLKGHLDRDFLEFTGVERDVMLSGDILEDSAYAPLVCCIAHRELFQRIGGIKEYPYHHYEDLEFACRMRRAGFQQGISGSAWVNHFGGMTLNEVCKSTKVRDVVESTRDRCIADIRALGKLP